LEGLSLLDGFHLLGLESVHSGHMHVEAVQRSTGLGAVLAAVQQAVRKMEVLHMFPHVPSVLP
jgi:hypothetical protein